MTNTEAVIDIVTVNKPAIVNPHRARAWLTDRGRRRQRGKGAPEGRYSKRRYHP
jgi:hypothetical protein